MPGEVRVNLIALDPVLESRLARFSARNSGISFRCSSVPLPETEVDLYLAPVGAIEGLLAPPADRARVRVPVIAYGQSGELETAFRAGCADFLREPWTVDELAARVRKRALPRSFPTTAGSVKLDGRTLSRRDRRVALTDPELRVFRALLLAPNEVVPRAVLFYALWGHDGGSSRAVDVHIASLRRKLGGLLPGIEPSSVIRCVRRGGYLLACERPDA